MCPTILWTWKEPKWRTRCVSNNQLVSCREYSFAASWEVKVDQFHLKLSLASLVSKQSCSILFLRGECNRVLWFICFSENDTSRFIWNGNVASSTDCCQKPKRLLLLENHQDCALMLKISNINPKKSCSITHHGVHFCGFFLHLRSRPRRFPHLLLYIPREKSTSVL
jgi:hypothetical protein